MSFRWRAALTALLGTLCAATNSIGQPTWQRTYGGFGPDRGNAIASTVDGGAIVVGSTGSFGTGGDAYVLRIDEQGDLLWSKVIGGDGVQVAFDVSAYDDSYFVVGMSQAASGADYDGWIARIADDGQIEWQVEIGSEGWDWFHGISVDDSGIYLCGVSFSTGGASGWIMRATMEGQVLWQRYITGFDAIELNDVASVVSGGCVVVGTTEDASGKDAVVARLDWEGQLVWQESVGTDSLDSGAGLCLTQDGSIVITGATSGFRPYPQMLIAKLDLDGGLIWLKHWGEGAEFEGRDIVERNDNGFALSGFTSAFGAGLRDFFVLKADPDGEYDFGATFGGGAIDEANGIGLLPDDGFIVCGSTQSFGPGPQSVLVVRTDSNADTESDMVEEFVDPVEVMSHSVADACLVFPNPCSVQRSIRLGCDWNGPLNWSLWDTEGRCVDQGVSFAQSKEISLSSILAGFYVLFVCDEADNSIRIPLVLE